MLRLQVRRARRRPRGLLTRLTRHGHLTASGPHNRLARLSRHSLTGHLTGRRPHNQLTELRPRGRLTPLTRARAWVRHWETARGAVEAAQLPGVTLSKAPFAVAFMLVAEFVTRRRIVARPGPVTHAGHFLGGEQLKLPHR